MCGLSAFSYQFYCNFAKYGVEKLIVLPNIIVEGESEGVIIFCFFMKHLHGNMYR